MTDANDSKGFHDNLNLGFGGKGDSKDFNMPIKNSDYVKVPIPKWYFANMEFYLQW